jgi:hypothetical protein
MFRGIAVASCALVSLITVGWAQSPTAEANKPAAAAPPAESSDTMEQPLPGDHWTYEYRDEITGTLKFASKAVVTDVTPSEISIRSDRIDNPGVAFFVYDRSWNIRSTPIWKYSPNDGTGIKQPLTTGSNWTFQGNDTGRAGSFFRSGSSKVLGNESVKTRAGTFNAIKIETSIISQPPHDPTKTSILIQTTWYEPSINHWVKRTSKLKVNGLVVDDTAAELVEYGRRSQSKPESSERSLSKQI